MSYRVNIDFTLYSNDGFNTAKVAFDILSHMLNC